MVEPREGVQRLSGRAEGLRVSSCKSRQTGLRITGLGVEDE